MKTRNYVAKNARKVNRAAVHKDRKRLAKQIRGQKHASQLHERIKIKIS
jgi:hypothetical protein